MDNYIEIQEVLIVIHTYCMISLMPMLGLRTFTHHINLLLCSAYITK